MALSIQYIAANRLKELESDWKSLESGQDMTLFQTFAWNNLLLEHYVPQDSQYFESLFAIVKQDNIIRLIAPLWITKKRFNFINKKGVYILGRDSYSDYLNMVYEEFSPDMISTILKDIKNKYKLNHFIFEQIREKSTPYQYLSGFYKLENLKKEPCVKLQLPKTIEEYHKQLSKHSRQNLRTANNRLSKDNKSINFNMDDFRIDKQKCLDIRESKLFVQYQKVPYIKKFKYRFINKLRFHFPRFTPITDFNQSKFMAAYIDGHLCAFFNYAYDEPHKRIVIMAAGTDLTFARYSPGMLLMYNFIKQCIQEGSYEEIDFTRGDEPYKFALGGELNYNCSFRITLKPSDTQLLHY